MSATSIELLLEEPSAEAALRAVMPSIAPGVDIQYRVFQGKQDLLSKLPQRLAGYDAWAPGAGHAVVLVVDRDDDDCLELKGRLEAAFAAARLRTPTASSSGHEPEALVRIIVEELEAWFFGDVPALVRAFPGVPSTLASRARFRDPDKISGGTWQQLERILQRAGHHVTGLRKVETARTVAMHMDVENNRSHSFRVFRDGVRSLVKENA